MKDVLERLGQIEERASKATPGPWEWAEDRFREKYGQRGRTGNWRSRFGRSLRNSWVYLLIGPRHGGVAEPASIHYDSEWDYPHVMALNWNQVKGSQLVGAGPISSGDTDFIAHARDDVPWLVEQLRAALSRLEVSG